MKKIRRFGVSLEEDLLEKLDSLARRNKFPNRSQAIRSLIRKDLVEDDWKANREVAGALVLIYDHHRRELLTKSTEVQHHYQNLIISTQHVHLDHRNCLEIIALKGKAFKLKELSDKLCALKGIKHGKLVMSAKE